MTKPLLLLSLPLIAAVAHPTKTHSDESSPANKQAEIDRIKTYEKEVNSPIWGRRSSLRQFAKNSPSDSWQEVKSPTRRVSQPFLEADIGIHKGKIARVFMRQPLNTSGRSDSSILLFRPDGTLAKYTLIAETNVKGKFIKGEGKFQYFNAQGQVLLTITASKDNKTGKITASPALSSPWLPIYKKTSNLPFYGLLKTRLRNPNGKPMM